MNLKGKADFYYRKEIDITGDEEDGYYVLTLTIETPLDFTSFDMERISGDVSKMIDASFYDMPKFVDGGSGGVSAGVVSESTEKHYGLNSTTYIVEVVIYGRHHHAEDLAIRIIECM